MPACNEDLELANQLYSSRFILFDKDMTSDYQVKRSYHLVTFSEPFQKVRVVGSQANKPLNVYFCICIEYVFLYLEELTAGWSGLGER